MTWITATVLFSALCAVTSAEKQLVLLAGPHQSGLSRVSKFFHHHASGSDGASSGMQGWIWPSQMAHEQVNDLPGTAHCPFENLVLHHDNETMTDLLLQSIQQAWDQADYGVIVGAENFDSTRGNPHSAGLHAMMAIVEHLNVSPNQVTVVLHYRTPRLDQWVGMYHNSQRPYNEFHCEEDYTTHLLEMPMNPVMLATVYREQGWNAVTIDLGGTEEQGLDPAHVVACNVLSNTDCENGWVSDQVGVTYDSTVMEHAAEFKDLSLEQQQDLEQMFQDRDCHYLAQLENDEGFTMIHRQSTWSGCQWSEKNDYYEQLADADHFVEQVKDLNQCSNIDGNESSQANHHKLVERVLGGTLILVVVVLMISWITYRRGAHMRSSSDPIPRLAVDLGDEIFPSDSFSPPGMAGLTDIDLQSPAGRRSPEVANAIQEPETTSAGGLYRVGLYQSPVEEGPRGRFEF